MANKRSDLDEAVQPFVSLYKLNEPLNLPDDKPLIEILPVIWPTWGELKRLYEALPKRHKEWRER